MAHIFDYRLKISKLDKNKLRVGYERKTPYKQMNGYKRERGRMEEEEVKKKKKIIKEKEENKLFALPPLF